MFSLNQPHLFIRDMDIYFTKQEIINCIAKYNFGEIYDCSILPGTTKFTNNVIIYIKKWGRAEYTIAAKTRLTNGQSIKLYYDELDCWKATSYDPTKMVSLKLKIANNVAAIIASVEDATNTTISTNNTHNVYTLPNINYGDCHKILPPHRKVCKKNI